MAEPSTTTKRFPKLPSRNWLIFWSVTASIAGLAAYDKWRLKNIRQSLSDRAFTIANQPLSPDVLPRKVIVYIEPTHWARYWFKEYVKPVFDAAALDYDLVEPSHAAKIRSNVREIMWKAREMHADQLVKQDLDRQRQKKRHTWMGWMTSYFYVERTDDPMAGLPPGMRLPKYDPSIGLVAVGPFVWRNMLLGLSEGNLTVPTTVDVAISSPILPDVIKPEETQAEKDGDRINSETDAEPSLPTIVQRTVPSKADDMHHLDASVEFPPIGFITGKNQSGWSGFPSRVLGFFNQRSLASQIGEEALMVAFEHTRPFVQGTDELHGEEDIMPLIASNKDQVEKNIDKSDDKEVLEMQAEEAMRYDRVDSATAIRLKVYAS